MELFALLDLGIVILGVFFLGCFDHNGLFRLIGLLHLGGLFRLGFLLDLSALLSGSLLHGLGGLDAPLGNLNAHAVFRGLKHDCGVVHLHNAADHAADGRDALALLQGVAHLFRPLFALVLGTDDHKIEHRDHDND